MTTSKISLRAMLSAGFSLQLAAIACVAAVTQGPRPPSASTANRNGASVQLSGDARILHALNRLTFGPRPGDVAAVKAMGLNKWIEQQLNPEKIDDSALNARLAMYPAMQMSLPQLMEQLPPPPVIRQVINGRIPVPQNSASQVVYQTQVALIEMREQARAERKLAQSAPAGQNNAQQAPPAVAQRVPASDPSVTDKEKQILADLQATSIVGLPPQQRMQKLIAMQPQQRIDFYRDLSLEDRIAFIRGLTPQQAQMFTGIMNPLRTVASQLLATKMLRVLDSNRQLQQVMVDFWFNHFNVDIRKSPLMPYYLTQYERQAIEPYAMGHFEDLLVATAHSPAMLVYLDNASSVGPHSIAAFNFERRVAMRNPQSRQPAPGLNENYGRELMELQTLGVNGGYTQQDVIEVAKAFTGWTVDRPLRGGGFIFNPRRHEPGTKYVLGHAIHEHGQAEGLEVLHILATSPATAHHISEELAERFVSDHPPQALVDRMAQTFLATHGDIRQVLRTMFASPEFWLTDTLNAKVKTPLEFVASAARAADTQMSQPLVLAVAVGRLGMPLYGCQPPTGYSTNADAWISSGALVERMNFAMAFANNRLPAVVNHWDALLGPDGATLRPSQKEAMLEARLLHGDVPAATHDAVLKELADSPNPPQPAPFPVALGGGGAYIVPAPQATPTPAATQPAPIAQLDRQAAAIAGLLIGSPGFQRR